MRDLMRLADKYIIDSLLKDIQVKSFLGLFNKLELYGAIYLPQG
jgi:hypothetical protein